MKVIKIDVSISYFTSTYFQRKMKSRQYNMPSVKHVGKVTCYRPILSVPLTLTIYLCEINNFIDTVFVDVN